MCNLKLFEICYKTIVSFYQRTSNKNNALILQINATLWLYNRELNFNITKLYGNNCDDKWTIIKLCAIRYVSFSNAYWIRVFEVSFYLLVFNGHVFEVKMFHIRTEYCTVLYCHLATLKNSLCTALLVKNVEI